MRFVLAAALVLSLASPAHADDNVITQHRADWFTAWSLLIGGGVMNITGAGLTTIQNTSASAAGWVVLGTGAATWIVGAVLLRHADLAAHARVGFDVRAGVVRF
jgi:hypothetical protein